MIRYYYFGIKWVFTCRKIRSLSINGNVCNNTFFLDLNIAEIIKFIFMNLCKSSRTQRIDDIYVVLSNEIG